MTDPVKSHPIVEIGGFKTIIATRKGLAEIMVSDCKGREPDSLPKLVFSSNGQGIAFAANDPAFAKAMNDADIVHADGMSVVSASRRWTKTPLPERICTTDFFEDAVDAAIKAELSFYFFGGSQFQNDNAIAEIRRRYPSLKIAGSRHGFFRAEEEDAICADIRASGADVLWVALGKPLQEFWSTRNREKLKGVGWIKTCGGLYGYLAGEEKRAPLWMREAGLEWVYRIMQNPKRLIWRYAVTNPHAYWCMYRAAMLKK